MTLVNTTKGPLDDSLLEKVEGDMEDDNEITNWIEYYLDGELVHRSVHVHLKKNIVADSLAAFFGE